MRLETRFRVKIQSFQQFVWNRVHTRTKNGNSIIWQGCIWGKQIFYSTNHAAQLLKFSIIDSRVALSNTLSARKTKTPYGSTFLSPTARRPVNTSDIACFTVILTSYGL